MDDTVEAYLYDIYECALRGEWDVRCTLTDSDDKVCGWVHHVGADDKKAKTLIKDHQDDRHKTLVV